MTDTDDPVMEMRPRCLVIVPGLSFEEFQERVWNPIKATHESLNFLLGDALVYCDVFGEQSSQLFDESLTPARMAQLKWVAEVIPPARRRDDCNWTMHRLVAGLFNRRRGIFPAAYLDRKAEMQDNLLARAAAEGWHTDSMKTAIADLERTALGQRGEYLSNGGPSLDGVDPEPPEDEEPHAHEDAAQDVEALPAATAADDGTVSDKVEEAERALDEPASMMPAQNIAEDAPALTELDPVELRACIEAVRVFGQQDGGDSHGLSVRLRRALGMPAYGDYAFDVRIGLSLFPGAWKRRIEEDTDLAGSVCWRVTGLKEGAPRAFGLSSDIGCAVVECALAAHLFDLGAAKVETAQEPEPPALREPTALEAAFAAVEPNPAKRLRDWLIRGGHLGEPAPQDEIFWPFFEVWGAAGEPARKTFCHQLVFGEAP